MMPKTQINRTVSFKGGQSSAERVLLDLPLDKLYINNSNSPEIQIQLEDTDANSLATHS